MERSPTSRSENMGVRGRRTRDRVGGTEYASAVATLDDLRRTADCLPGSEERSTTGGAAWFVAGLLKKKPGDPEIPEKSILDRT